MHPYSSIDATAAWKKLCFILSVRSDFHIIDSLLIAVHAFVNLMSMSLSIDATLLPKKKIRYFLMTDYFLIIEQKSIANDGVYMEKQYFVAVNLFYLIM